MAPIMAKCVRCGSHPERPQKCGRCRNVAYCGRECQQADWAHHKAVCCQTIQDSFVRQPADNLPALRRADFVVPTALKRNTMIRDDVLRIPPEEMERIQTYFRRELGTEHVGAAWIMAAAFASPQQRDEMPVWVWDLPRDAAMFRSLLNSSPRDRRVFDILRRDHWDMEHLQAVCEVCSRNVVESPHAGPSLPHITNHVPSTREEDEANVVFAVNAMGEGGLLTRRRVAAGERLTLWRGYHGDGSRVFDNGPGDR